jgi:hypothetical protein
VGAWGTGPFENDDAADFVATLDDLDPDDRTDAIREALTEAAQQADYLERDAASEAIAAAAILAAQLPDAEPLDSARGPKEPIEPLPDELRPIAVAALTRVLADESELNELWADSPDGEAWLTTVADLTDVLTRPEYQSGARQ